MDGEIDYMSDEFLAQCLGGNNESRDVRPGLLHSRSARREHKLMKERHVAEQQKKKPVTVYEAEALERGLSESLSSTNKGFSMLQKMGYKSGTGLGKHCSGIKEPIPLNIKNNKKGLGHKPAAKRKRVDKVDEINIQNFTSVLSKKDRERKVCSDLKKSQKICYELDLKNNKYEPSQSWFWPDDVKEEKEINEGDGHSKDDFESEQYSTEEMLKTLTKHLRDNYYYCIWCSIQYNDEKDMLNCPGASRDDH